ncbi:hypothetical protein SERLA73DRAFT_152874 [Serpula lacrymans var. lacrymans S7.3]|uniref:Uncharacterized protein n=2 Tax=Serpula lacrymans var. lacrymans TaxID=341189 RepID=F8PZ94_SERL3|nr:uncharacterized protein SERLADRAFT_408621 [Serpula lacrymans var. lacrymans S7.9]EGN99207.1 hypothetical protein SERLA73DRAFT_152874 [Serpula lacrymans var. lacrymans S7.3]EGO24773.1 hypothetical protein SERLADRAFT_408621 [Serpula lacrymans var. lacrymans S7.9]
MSSTANPFSRAPQPARSGANLQENMNTAGTFAEVLASVHSDHTNVKIRLDDMSEYLDSQLNGLTNQFGAVDSQIAVLERKMDKNVWSTKSLKEDSRILKEMTWGVKDSIKGLSTKDNVNVLRKDVDGLQVDMTSIRENMAELYALQLRTSTN